jgi:hypothetical protein
MRGATIDYQRAAAAVGRLRALVSEREAALAALARIDGKIDKAAFEADQSGVQVTEIAQVLGVSRQSTHRILNRSRT